MVNSMGVSTTPVGTVTGGPKFKDFPWGAYPKDQETKYNNIII